MSEERIDILDAVREAVLYKRDYVELDRKKHPKAKEGAKVYGLKIKLRG